MHLSMPAYKVLGAVVFIGFGLLLYLLFGTLAHP